MMDEYISREAAISHPFANGQYDREHASKDFIMGYESYKEWLEALPAANVRPVVKGEWLTEEHFERTIDGSTIAIRATYCSECGCVLLGKFDNFCPNCGADMRKEANDVSRQ